MVSVMASIQAQMAYDCVEDPGECWCRGGGWVVTDWDSTHKCPHHYRGQPGPEDAGWAWDFWADTLEAEHGGQFPVIPALPEVPAVSGLYAKPGCTEEDMVRVAWQQRILVVATPVEDIPF